MESYTPPTTIPSERVQFRAVIRPANNRDTDGIVGVIKTVFEEYGFGWYPDGYCSDVYDVEARYWGVGNKFYVLEEEGEIVGTAALDLFETLPGEFGTALEWEGKIRAGAADCSLERLYLLPNARGAGRGAALFDRILSEARSEGRRAMELWSDKQLTLAHAFYRRRNCILIGDRICPGDPDQASEWGFVLGLE